MYRIRVRVPASMQTTVEEMLLGIADATRVRIDRDDVEVFGYSYRRPDASKFAAALTGTGIHTAACQLETVPDDDWVSQGLANLPCVRAGRFVLRGSHLPAPPTVRHDICIDAGPAFGTGHHPTTAMVIETLAGLALRRFRPHRALDIGTGAGVLAIVMARLWRCPVLAVDHDPDAVAYARENVVRNRVTRWVDVVEADGCNATGDVFDVIAANLFAGSTARLGAAGWLAACRRAGTPRYPACWYASGCPFYMRTRTRAWPFGAWCDARTGSRSSWLAPAPDADAATVRPVRRVLAQRHQ